MALYEHTHTHTRKLREFGPIGHFLDFIFFVIFVSNL